MPPGDPCPEPVDVALLGHRNCSPTPDYLATCSFTQRVNNQQADGYAGWVPAGSGGGIGPVVA